LTGAHSIAQSLLRGAAVTDRQSAQAKARIFKALGHPTRIGIVEMLVEGERCVCEIVPAFGDAQATISRHLDVLLQAGIVRRRRDGVKMIYGLAMPCLLNVMPCIVEALRKRAGTKVPTLKE
jgi:DNA-binding transcriptional ArsR family regulator